MSFRELDEFDQAFEKLTTTRLNLESQIELFLDILEKRNDKKQIFKFFIDHLQNNLFQNKDMTVYLVITLKLYLKRQDKNIRKYLDLEDIFGEVKLS
eukprot:CAMPEP_0114577258 /NCGR_PEP_ID=MMETSP0125-20121206/1938_1 /TAXON_ID=485358 ORGANISM="Aristerostoma sp., Strain ATCC 50986" /NCGR_SAMPLE_ID=MMETSP0125 /ASSEMBLY_ACC=CAM_ASM_000245 /LENGTH=96 /DNA_ID=CAMNT_0001766429 /DNA_START=412 /DNA_END=703 /DNA_ORIENTATION=+